MMRVPLPIRAALAPAVCCLSLSALACGPVPPVRCTMIGCLDALTVQSSRLASLLAAEPTLTVRTCVDGRCTQAVEAGGSCRGSLRCAGETVTVLMQRPDDLGAGTHLVTIAISRPDGTVLLSDRVAGVRFDHRNQPNGPGCEPTCYGAAVRLPDA